MAWYEYPNSTDTEGIFEFFGYINRITEGLFFPTMLIVVWFVSFIGVFSSGLGGRPAGARAFAFSSFITAILSILLSIMGFLAPKFMYLTFILVAISVLWLKMEQGD